MPVLFDSSRNAMPVNNTSAIPKKRIRRAVGIKEKKERMGAYIQNPHRIRFATQGKNEQIALFLRQHPITQLPWVLSSFILMLIPPLLLPIIFRYLPFSIPGNYQIIFILFWYLTSFAFIFINFILWYYNVNIVTNKRVIDIDFLYLLVQEVTATRITQIEDVTIRRVGVFAGLFDYGNVFVQTAGTEVNIEFLRIPKPRQVSRVIIRLMGQTT